MLLTLAAAVVALTSVSYADQGCISFRGVINVNECGAKGDGVHDDTLAIQAAYAQAAAANGRLEVPPGTYRVCNLVISAGNVGIHGPARTTYDARNGAVLKAAKGCTTRIISTVVPNIRNVTIENLVFNGNDAAAAGIFMDTTIEWIVKGNYFVNFPSGAAHVKGGGNLYLRYSDNSHGGSGRALDFQNSYSSVSRETYYGCNSCWFRENTFSAGMGVRVSGNVHFVNNDFEMALKAPALAALDISDPGPGAEPAEIIGNYFEMARGFTVTPLRAINATGHMVSVRDNDIYGHSQNDPGSTAIDVLNAYFAEISGNKISDWANGIRLSQVASSERSKGSQLVVANYFGLVETEVTPVPTTRQAAMEQGSEAPALITTDEGFLFLHRSLVTSTCESTGKSVLDLRLCNDYYLKNGSPITISATRNGSMGQHFSITANGNTTTLANPAFHLCTGKDFRMPSGAALYFVVDYGGMVREICPSGSDRYPAVYNFSGTRLDDAKEIFGTRALVGGEAVVNFGGNFSFTSPQTFGCTATDQSAPADAAGATPQTSNSIVLRGKGDHIVFYRCIGS
jgi:hypothetical protein